MIKTCTDLQQSKKLIELGIDVNTADMYWQDIGGVTILTFEIIGVDTPKDSVIPAWSFTALFELIPPYLGEFNDGIDFGFSKSMNGKWYSAHYIKLNDNGLATFNKTVTGDTAIDAAFNMVCWLKENKKI
jgi:hypothetical protein